MQTRCQRLQGIPVKTRSGKLIGKLGDLSIETDTGRLDAILVRSRGFIPGLALGELRISWSQVVSLSPEEIIVVDNVASEASRRLAFGMGGKQAT